MKKDPWSKLSILFTLLFFFAIQSDAQTKKKIDSRTYNLWSTVRNYAISANGLLVFYELSYLESDSKLYFINKKSSLQKMFARAKKTSLANNDQTLAFLIEPEYDSLRKLKLNETPKDKLPKDSLGIYHILKDTLVKFADVKSYQASEYGKTICFLSNKDLRPECPKEDSKKKKKKKSVPCLRPSTSGSTLTIYNGNDLSYIQKHCVTNYKLDKWSNSILYITSKKGKTKDTLSLIWHDLSSNIETAIIENQFAIGEMCFDESSNQIAFYASDDTNKVKNYNLYYATASDKTPQKIVDSLTSGMPHGYTVSENGSLFFNHDGQAILFGIGEIKTNPAKDTLLESEKAKVDIWGSNDSRIQPLQLAQLNLDKNKSYTSIYYLKSKKLVQLENEAITRVLISEKTNSNFVLGISNEKYLREMSWAYPWSDDYYLIDITTGETKLLLESQPFRTSLSPSGNYLAYYSGKDSSWYCLNTSTKSKTKLAGTKDDVFATDMNGMPSVAEDEGFYGWTIIAKKEYCMVQSDDAVWLLSVEDNKNNKRLSFLAEGKTTYYRNDYDSLYTNLQNNYFIYTHPKTKNQSIVKLNTDDFTLEELIATQHKIVSIDKARAADTLLYRAMNFYDYPDLTYTDINFEKTQKISNCNPQQVEYNWGTVEHISWKSYDGVNLDGLLYKPEDFDPTKKYPMIVYFYEKYSDDIHNYYAPKPTASIIYPTEYVSNGYIVFIPDIIYKEGYPAKSAYNCIMSGTDYVIRNNNWIDSTRMGLQGQSWGGYQTAQLITMTNRFKAAMAGAPVSNMFSAYGGIRWTSGLSRQFQYERTQSRIGYTIWERPDLYMANSPIFGLPKVETPLLIMSNDGDGAVPWYQGIELYMGLRRLNKPVWLLNYNGDEHNLMIHANRKDLSIRMRQFFDYYLMDAPQPIWMIEGVPATEKGKNYGYETTKP